VSEKEVRNYPKCVGETEKSAHITGYLTIAVRFTKVSDSKGDIIIPYYCKNCGFIELYKEIKGKKENPVKTP